MTLPPYWGAAWLVNALYSPPNLAPIGVIYYSPYMAGAVVFVAITASAVWKLRLSTQRGLTSDFRLTLLLLVALPTLIVGTMFAGCNLTYCGA